MNKTLEEIKKHIMVVNDILLKETNKEKPEPQWKVWIVYWLDWNWLLYDETMKIYSKREDAFKYYSELAQEPLNTYKKYCTDLATFSEGTQYEDCRWDFWIKNCYNEQCRTWFEYEQCILTELPIL